MKNYKKLEILNQKIAKLSCLQKEIEAKILESVSKQIAGILLKKNVSSIDIPAFLKKVENLVDDINAMGKHC
jgi:3-deoxy-D-manno-octulosonic acid (KDO) 8-phosphate synthase